MCWSWPRIRTAPLLERVRFLAIFSANLDEFFMKRVGGLQRQQHARVTELSLDGLTPRQQLDEIHAHLRPMLEQHMTCWLDDLKPALESEGVIIRDYDALEPLDRTAADQFFVRNVFPILTPLAVDPAHPFPFISNLSNSIGVILEHPTRKETLFVRIKVPENLPRWVPLAAKLHFVPLEQVIGGNLSLLFPGMKVMEHQPFRVTRNADIEMDAEDADDLLQLVEQELRARRMAQGGSAGTGEIDVIDDAGIHRLRHRSGRARYLSDARILDMSDLAALADLEFAGFEIQAVDSHDAGCG